MKLLSDAAIRKMLAAERERCARLLEFRDTTDLLLTFGELSVSEANKVRKVLKDRAAKIRGLG